MELQEHGRSRHRLAGGRFWRAQKMRYQTLARCGIRGRGDTLRAVAREIPRAAGVGST